MKIKWPARSGRAVRNASKSPGLVYDCELAAQIKEGDRKALRHLVERHLGRARNYLLHRLGEGHEQFIDRVLAATLNEALRHIGPYSAGSASTPIELWLIRLVEKNLVRMGRELRIETRASSSQAPNDSDLAQFRGALSRIPERYRAVLILAVVEQMPAADIAAALGVSPAAGMRRLRAALKHLGSALESQEAG
jgi:DNA-directed RNA polymerase specialized sigma24 family protein